MTGARRDTPNRARCVPQWDLIQNHNTNDHTQDETHIPTHIHALAHTHNLIHPHTHTNATTHTNIRTNLHTTHYHNHTNVNTHTHSNPTHPHTHTRSLDPATYMYNLHPSRLGPPNGSPTAAAKSTATPTVDGPAATASPNCDFIGPEPSSMGQQNHGNPAEKGQVDPPTWTATDQPASTTPTIRIRAQVYGPPIPGTGSSHRPRAPRAPA
jgi:hypothetical protein